MIVIGWQLLQDILITKLNITTDYMTHTHKVTHKNLLMIKIRPYPFGIYLLKVNNRNTGTRCEICSNLTIKTVERRH